MLQRIVPVVVAEGSLGMALARRNHPFDGELGCGDEGETAGGIGDAAEALALEQRGQQQFGKILGQGSDGGQHEGRGAADEDDQRQRLAALLGHVVVEAAALLDLPVDAGGGVVVALNAVHPQVVVAGVGVFGVDQRQGDEVAAILGPGLEQGDAGEPRRILHARGDGAASGGLQADFQGLGHQVAVLPQFARRQGGQVLGELHELVDELFGAGAEGQVHAFGCAEEVGDAGEVGVFDVGEEQGRSRGGDHAAVDLGDLLVGIDGGVDSDEFIFAAEQIEELAEVDHEGDSPDVGWVDGRGESSPDSPKRLQGRPSFSSVPRPGQIDPTSGSDSGKR